MYYYPEDNHLIPVEPEEEHVFICDACGGPIYEGENYYDIDGDKWCEECIRNASHLA